MEKIILEVGMTYEDPEGIWEITGIGDKFVDIKNITDDDPNFGKEYIVTVEEAEYYKTHDWWV